MAFDILGGLQYIQQQGQAGKLEGQRSRLAELASSAYSAAPDQRTGILSQMARIDPASAQTQQRAFESDDDRRQKQLVSMARVLHGAPETFRESLYQRMRPDLLRMGVQAPEAYTPEVGQLAQQLAMMGQGASGVQSTYVDADGNRVAILRDGSTRVLGKNDEGMANQTITVTGADGRPRQMTFNKRTGSYEEAGAQQPSMPSGPSVGTHSDVVAAAAQQMQANGIPHEQIEAWIAQVTGGTVVDGLPPQAAPAQSPASSMFVGQSPAEKAAAETGARLRAEAAYKPAIEAAVTNARIGAELSNAPAVAEADASRQGAIKRAEAEAELAAVAAKKAIDSGDMIGLLDAAEKILPVATNGRLENVRDQGAAFFGVSTPGAKATRQLSIIAAELVAKIPRFEGPQSNIDVQFYRDAAGDLANPDLPVETRMAALQTMRQLRQKYAAGGSGQQAARPAQNSPKPAGGWTIQRVD